ncbi:MAG: TlpA family protein disulfide reductase [Oscillospiraceae bacterium]|jgi:thiol-disulfide isomerase/thioredoxin
MQKLIYLLIAFALVLATGVLGYRYLSQRVAPAVPLPAPSQGESSADSAEDSSSQPQEPQKIPAPDFTAYDADGNPVKLSDQLGTVPVVLNFWASWCPPCRMEMPHFDKIAAEYDSDVLRFLMVDMVGTSGSYIETREKAQSYLQEEGFTFPVWFDEDQDALMTYGISAFPSTVFIDAQGNVEGAYSGAMSEETLRMFLQELFGL